MEALRAAAIRDELDRIEREVTYSQMHLFGPGSKMPSACIKAYAMKKLNGTQYQGARVRAMPMVVRPERKGARYWDALPPVEKAASKCQSEVDMDPKEVEKCYSAWGSEMERRSKQRIMLSPKYKAGVSRDPLGM